MKIRKATLHDIERLITLSNQAKIYLKALGVDQWQDGYPNHHIFEMDITAKQSYVVIEDGDVIGSFMFSLAPDPTYTLIEGGSWRSEGVYGVMHRIMVDDDYKGKGISDFIIQEAIQMCQKGHATSLRVDTHLDNRVMQRMLERNGFKECGIIFLEDHSKRLAYDLLVEPNETT